jgi:hypothetical protein
MSEIPLGFTAIELRNGAILGTIAYAVWLNRDPLLCGMQSWNSNLYLLNDFGGTLATIAFIDNFAVGGFFDANSIHSPVLIDHFVNAANANEVPLVQKDTLTKMVSPYMMQQYKGNLTSVITCFIWTTDDDNIVSFETRDEFLQDGGHIIGIQILPKEDAILRWQEEFNLSNLELNIVQNIYSQKAENNSFEIRIEGPDSQFLKHGRGGKQCEELLLSIGIRLL